MVLSQIQQVVVTFFDRSYVVGCMPDAHSQHRIVYVPWVEIDPVEREHSNRRIFLFDESFASPSEALGYSIRLVGRLLEMKNNGTRGVVAGDKVACIATGFSGVIVDKHKAGDEIAIVVLKQSGKSVKCRIDELIVLFD